MLPIVPIASVMAGLLLAYNSKPRRRARARRQPTPPWWTEILERRVRLYRVLPSELRGQLHDLMKVFLDEKMFEACGGLELEEEMPVVVAGLACMLLLNRPCHYYPGAYIAENQQYEGGVKTEGAQGRLGESASLGNVVLSWADVVESAANAQGRNLVLHEFAHQLDQEDGRGDGVPILREADHYESWAHVLSAEYHELVDRVERGQRTFLRAYGATNPAEFFAVTTEAFFEQPQQMKERHPELYREFCDYYRVDPGDWVPR